MKEIAVKDEIIMGEGDGGVHEKVGGMESRDRGISLRRGGAPYPFLL